MKRFAHTISKSVAVIESTPTNYTLWLTSFTSLIFARLMVEGWMSNFESNSLQFFFYEFTHTFFFFLLSFLIFWPFIARFGKTSLRAASNILLFGFLIILTPPIIDAWIAGGPKFLSFYKFDTISGLWHRYLTLFGDRPDFGITYGVRIEVVITTLLFGSYVFIKSRDLPRAITAAVFTYSTLFILGTLPSWITFVFLAAQKPLLSINDIDIAGLFLSPPTLFNQSSFAFISALNIKLSLIFAPLTMLIAAFYLWRYFPKKFYALINNIRIPQIIFSSGLVCAGIALALSLTDASFAITIFNIIGLADIFLAANFAWLASVIVNDLFDQKIDSITNPSRPLQQKAFSTEEYRSIGITFFFMSLIFSGIVSFKAMLLILIYQGLAWIYSAWPFRLKRFPIIATFLASVANILILIVGFVLIAPNGNISSLPNTLLAFLAIISTIFISVKDFKDIVGDKADDILTIPVIFGEERGKIIIGSGIFFSYVSSILALHESKLFFWAILSGGISFWIIAISTPDEKNRFSYRRLSGWILGILALYGIILITIIA